MECPLTEGSPGAQNSQLSNGWARTKPHIAQAPGLCFFLWRIIEAKVVRSRSAFDYLPMAARATLIAAAVLIVDLVCSWLAVSEP